MIVRINKVKACRNKAYGNFLLRGHESALITISLKLNPMLAEYGATLLHELLHLWITMMRREGFRGSDKKEHEFIYEVEDQIVRIMKRHFKVRK